jgi:DNA-binding CsgD family transcriptional regulator
MNIQLLNNSALNYSLEAIPKMKAISKPLTDYLGINLFGYLRIYNDCKYLSLLNGFENYLTNYYNTILTQEEFFIKLLKTTSPDGKPHFYLGPTEYDQVPPIISLYIENNFWHDFAITYRNNDYCEMFWFAFYKDSGDKSNFYIQNLDSLVKFSNHFKASLDDIILSFDKNKLAVYPKKFDLSPIFSEEKENFNAYLNKNLIIKNSMGRTVSLAPRELQCLENLVKNKTAKESAKILNLSHRTVEAYINNLKQKLGVTYKKELFNLYHDSLYY